MIPSSLERIADGQYKVHGELTFNTIAALLAHSVEIFNTKKELNIDLSAVTLSDSAGLALLIEWLRMARKNNIALQFKDIPTQLNSIAKVCSLDTILYKR